MTSKYIQLAATTKMVYAAASKMSQVAAQEIKIPRQCKRQTLRSNVEADTPEAYYRRAMFVPLLDNLVQQMSERFPQLTLHAARGLCLVPTDLDQLEHKNLDELKAYYEDDMPSPVSFEQVRLWRRQWRDCPQKDKPAALQATLEHKACSAKVYPNIHSIVHHLLMSPVTSAGVERANSSLKFTKSPQEYNEGGSLECAVAALRPQGYRTRPGQGPGHVCHPTSQKDVFY